MITQKFIQTGNDGMSEDIVVHRQIMGIGLTEEDRSMLTAPEIFSYPCSPDLAARIDKRDIDFGKIGRAAGELEKRYDIVLIEGAGGVMVPLKGEYLTIDYMKESGMPAIVVTNGQLGSINHTLLTLEAIRTRGIELAEVVYNGHFDKDAIICADTKQYIRGYLAKHFPAARFTEMC